MFYVKFNNTIDRELDIACTERPDIPMPKKKYNPIDIQGADGQLYEDLDAYEDIVITCNYNLLEYRSLKEKSRKIKKWLFILENNKLIFSDDMDYFYKVKKVDCDALTRDPGLIELSTIPIQFTCDPYAYSMLGSEEIELKKGAVLYNNEMLNSKPIINIFAEGLVELNVNGNTLTINVGQNVTIDSEEGLCYRQNGDIVNSSKKGEYPYLVTGENRITWTGNVNRVTIVPNYRSL